jgi:hypothetical protein
LRVHFVARATDAERTLVIGYGNNLCAVLTVLTRFAPTLTNARLPALARALVAVTHVWVETPTGYCPMTA